MTTYSYYSSSSLYSNVNKTKAGNETLTAWLKDSYNATVGSSSDMLDLLSQLKHNAAFNPYDSIDTYITGLENTPLGNMKNDDANGDGVLDDHDYYMYTISTAPTSTYTGTTAMLTNGVPTGYPIQNGNYYFATQADSDKYTTILAGSAASGATVTGCLSSGKKYTITLPKTDDYAQGVKINNDTGYIDPNASGKTVDSEVAAFLADSNSKIGGVSINGANTTQLVAMYKQLTAELSGLKEYTLTNDEIASMKSEIDTLNGDGVKGNYEKKIDKAEKELDPIFENQLNKLYNDGYIFEKSDLKTAKDAFSTAKDATLQKLFGENGSTTDYVNNPFYQYVVGLRTDSKLDFIKSFNETFPDWNKSSTAIKKDINSTDTVGQQPAAVDKSFDPSKYSGVKEQDDRLGPTDILSKLYGTQELIALYKSYEDSQNKANSMTLSMNVALQDSAEFDFRKVLAAKILDKISNATGGTEALLSLSNEINTATTIERGCSSGPSALKGISVSQSTPTFDGFYGDQNTLGLKSNSSQTDGESLVDPYEVTINGTKYIFGQDNDSNSNIDSVSELLGISDTQSNPFSSLMSLDTNKDGIVSKDELIANHIILKAVDDSGKLTKSSFDTSLISGIDLSKIDKTQNGTSAGSFSVKLANGATVAGAQTFDDQSYFNKLFGTVVNLKPYQTTASTTSTTSTTTSSTSSSSTKSTTTSAAIAAATTTTAAATTPAATEDVVHKNLLAKINSAYSALIIDDTSNIETTLTNLCWKHSVSLTPAQKVKIIDSIDPLTPTDEVEAKIIQAISTLNVKA